MDQQIVDHLILERFRTTVAKIYSGRLERVVLFGSRESGDARPDSDYDIAVFLRDLSDRAEAMKRLADIGTDILHEVVASSTPCHTAPVRIASEPPLCTKSNRIVFTCEVDPSFDTGHRRFLGWAYNFKSLADYDIGGSLNVTSQEPSEAIQQARGFVAAVTAMMP